MNLTPKQQAVYRYIRDFIRSSGFAPSFDEIRPLLDYGHPKNAHLRQVVSYWEMAASFVLRGILHPDVYLDTCDEGIFTYAALEEQLPKIREVRPNFLKKTESVIQGHPPIKTRLMEIRTRLFRARDRRAAETGEGDPEA